MSEAPDTPAIVLTDDEREIVRRAHFGDDVEAFAKSNVGQYLFSLADQLEEANAAELLRVNPTDHVRIAEYQVQARAAAFLKSWLLEAVQAGLEAWKEINEEAE